MKDPSLIKKKLKQEAYSLQRVQRTRYCCYLFENLGSTMYSTAKLNLRKLITIPAMVMFNAQLLNFFASNALLLRQLLRDLHENMIAKKPNKLSKRRNVQIERPSRSLGGNPKLLGIITCGTM
jgi:hypothetical protein